MDCLKRPQKRPFWQKQHDKEPLGSLPSCPGLTQIFESHFPSHFSVCSLMLRFHVFVEAQAGGWKTWRSYNLIML